MELGTVKVILVLSRRWNVLAGNDDVPNAYVKADKEKDLNIYKRVPSGMQVDQDILDHHGDDDTKHHALLLKNQCTEESKPEDYGASYCTPSWPS